MSGRGKAARLRAAWVGGEERLAGYVETRPPASSVAQARAAFAHAQNSETREWLLEHMRRTDPEPGQRPDTMLGSKIGLKERSGQAMQIYGRVSEIVPEEWGTQIRLAVNRAGLSPKVLKSAFAKVGRIQLRQMQNAGLRSAGFVMDPKISATGEIDLCAVITDPLAAQKLATRTYTGCVVSFDGDEISDISLVDSPVSFMQKRSGLICKVFDGGGGVKKAALWPSAQRVIDEQERIARLAQNGTDRLIVKAAQDRNTAAYGVELIKAARTPSNMLHGPRYQR